MLCGESCTYTSCLSCIDCARVRLLAWLFDFIRLCLCRCFLFVSNVYLICIIYTNTDSYKHKLNWWPAWRLCIPNAEAYSMVHYQLIYTIERFRPHQHNSMPFGTLYYIPSPLINYVDRIHVSAETNSHECIEKFSRVWDDVWPWCFWVISIHECPSGY